MLRLSLALLSLVVAPSLALVQLDSRPGRFASLDPGQPVRQAVNGSYSLDLEKVLKVHALMPQRDGGRWGKRVYAGSLSVCAPDGTWGHGLPEGQRRQTLRWLDDDRVLAGLAYTAGDWSADVQAELTADDPRLRFVVTRTGGDAPLQAGLLGYSWAERRAPLSWTVDGVGGFPMDDKPQVFRSPRRLYARDAAGFTMTLAFSVAPEELHIDADGLTWRHAPEVSRYELTYQVLPGRLSDDDAVIFQTAARRTRLELGSDGRDCWADLRADGMGAVVVPPTLAPLVKPAGSTAELVAGQLQWQPGPMRIVLPKPPGLDRVLPEFKALSAAEAARLTAQVSAVLARQRPDGTFPFNEGRTFHEGTTLAVLCEVSGLLPADLQAKVRAAVEQGLRYAWGHLTPISERPWDLMPPEQPGFTGAGIDYPEILACLLQATVLHSRRWHVDPLVPEGVLAAQVRQLAAYMDRSGVALANPGPTFHHLIAESAIGGYLAWQALSQMRYGDRPAPWTNEARARAAYAWQAWRTMFGFRTVFGEPPVVVNGLERGCLELDRGEPWVYVQSTWFTHLPCFELPASDDFGIWKSLAQQPWHEWTGKLGSTQRAYDAANATALARAGQSAEVAKVWPAMLTRPYVWDTFDQTPVLELAAIGWLATLR